MRESNKYEHPALVLGEIGLVHNLGSAGIPIFVGSEIKENPSLYSRYTKKRIYFSDYTSHQLIEELCEFGRELGKKTVLFSDDDHAILNITQHQEELSPYFLFNFPSPNMVKQLLDKQLFCSLIDKYNLPAPVSVTISSVEEVEKKIVKSFPFPAIIKPSFKQAWWSNSFNEELGDYQKAIKCNDFKDLIKTYKKIAKVNPHVVVQEYIEGDESQIYSVNMYVDSSGELKGYFIAQKLRTYPVRAGEGSYITTVKDPEMISMAMNIATKLKLTGLLNIQFKRDSRTGKPVLLEVHTRNSVWSYLGTVAGANLAATYYRDMTDDADHEESKYKPGVKFIFVEKDLKAFLQNIKEKELPVFDWLRSYLTKFTPGGYKLTDPLPALMKLWFILKRRIIT